MNRTNITVMRKERRRDRRSAVQLESSLGGHPITLIDISASGFGSAIDATSRTFQTFRIGWQGYLDLKLKTGESVSIPVEIVRSIPEENLIGGSFLELSVEAYDFIEPLITGRPRRRR